MGRISGSLVVLSGDILFVRRVHRKAESPLKSPVLLRSHLGKPLLPSSLQKAHLRLVWAVAKGTPSALDKSGVEAVKNPM